MTLLNLIQILIKYLHVLFFLPLVIINHEITPVEPYSFLNPEQDFPSDVTDSAAAPSLDPQSE